jgi:hypothetical protein
VNLHDPDRGRIVAWRIVGPGVYGLSISVAAQALLAAYWPAVAGGGNSHPPWWLNSLQGTVLTLAWIFVAALVGALLQRAAPWSFGVGMLVGVMCCNAGILAVIGPGNLWPIVLVVCNWLSAATIGIAVGLVDLSRRLVGWSPG